MVSKFIDHFHTVSADQTIDRVFTEGCCYWFALILCTRFPGAEMMYDLTSNHFVAKIKGHLYDITGDVSGKYSVIRWDDYGDNIHRERIEKYCINFTE